MSNLSSRFSTSTAITWCLAWGTDTEPQYPDKIDRWREVLQNGQTPIDEIWQQAQAQAEVLTQRLTVENGTPSLSDIADLETQYPVLGDRTIGLIYGGVTKVKSYVFESVDLQEIRGASALLDRINLVDLPALFHAETYYLPESEPNPYSLCKEAPAYCKQVRIDTFSPLSLPSDAEDAASISKALIPELVIYSTGGNILAFCPVAFVNQLCDAIEKRYTTETLTANSCAVSMVVSPLEIYCGLLKDDVKSTLWQEQLLATHQENPALQAYFGVEKGASVEAAFKNRKNFGEIVGQLTSQFNQRRSGNDVEARPTRRYPAMFETHPYLVRDDSDIRSMVESVDLLPDIPKLSDPTARKRRVGQITKRDEAGGNWYRRLGFEARWNPQPTEDSQDSILFRSWVSKFEKDFLKLNDHTRKYDRACQLLSERGNFKPEHRYRREARSLHEIGDRSNGYVGYIYADGNSMGRYIREQVKTPEGYQQFSDDIFKATEESVYEAIAQHLSPHYYQPDAKSSRQPDEAQKAPVWIHPFEIITIGGDDVLLVVPANKALEIAATIGTAFEASLIATGRYNIKLSEKPIDLKQQHRYNPTGAQPSRCQLSTSMGVLITAVDTPIYYAEKLVSQLLKSSKKRLKQLNNNHYHGGTVDFLVLKAVTMITSNIEAFRQEGLTIQPPKADPERSPKLPPLRQHTLKLYASPYTLHELRGLVSTIKAVKQSQFPKSQLYQIRSLLERGKRTAMLNYRYFRVRLDTTSRNLLESKFEQAWCNAETNDGNLAPWQTTLKINGDKAENRKTTYETIWRELVELEPFIEVEENGIEENGIEADSSATKSVKVQSQSTGGVL